MPIGAVHRPPSLPAKPVDPTLAAMRKALMNLTPHFTLNELVFSSRAVRLQLDNTPSREGLEHLKTLAMGLEQLRSSRNSNTHRFGLPLRFVELLVYGEAHSASKPTALELLSGNLPTSIFHASTCLSYDGDCSSRH
jgi:hypothetical protein